MCVIERCDGKATELVTHPEDGGIRFVCKRCRDELVEVFGYGLALAGSDIERGSTDPSDLRTD